MGYFAIHETLWPACVSHLVSAVSSLLLAILIGALPDVFLVGFANGFDDIIFGEHDPNAFDDGPKYFLIVVAVMIMFASLACGVLMLWGILNERPKGRAIVFYIEVIFGLLSFIGMCMCADKARHLEGPRFVHGLLKGWEKGMDMNACERAVETERETCETALTHLSNCSSAQAQVVASSVFWAINVVSLFGSAIYLCMRGIVQIDSIIYCYRDSSPKADI